MVVLGEDPLAAVTAYRNVESVYLGGRKLDLGKLFETPAGPWRPSR